MKRSTAAHLKTAAAFGMLGAIGTVCAYYPEESAMTIIIVLCLVALALLYMMFYTMFRNGD